MASWLGEGVAFGDLLWPRRCLKSSNPNVAPLILCFNWALILLSDQHHFWGQWSPCWFCCVLGWDSFLCMDRPALNLWVRSQQGIPLEVYWLRHQHQHRSWWGGGELGVVCSDTSGEHWNLEQQCEHLRYYVSQLGLAQLCSKFYLLV